MEHLLHAMADLQLVQMADRSRTMAQAPMVPLTPPVLLMPAVLLGQLLLLGHLTKPMMPDLKLVLEGYLPEMLQCHLAQMPAWCGLTMCLLTAAFSHPLATQACHLSCRHLHLRHNRQLLPMLARQHPSSQTMGLMMHCTWMTLQWALAITVGIERWLTWDSRLPLRSKRWLFDQKRLAKVKNGKLAQCLSSTGCAGQFT